MQRAFFWIVLLLTLFVSSIGAPGYAQSTDPEGKDGVVHAVMFWLQTCPHCHVVIEQVLPPLQQQYGEQLDIQLIEVSSRSHSMLLNQAANMFALPSDQVGVPFMVIGDHVLIGADQIPTELPGLIEQYLASGGVNYPDIPGLADALPEGATTSPDAAVAARPSGFGLAITVMVGMVVALLATGVMVVQGIGAPQAQRTQRGSRPRSVYQTTKRVAPAATPATRGWLDLALPVLALLGLAVAGYLAYVETQAVEAVCGPVGDCNAVQTSSYASLFGLVPIGVLGMLAYALILSAWLWQRLRPDDRLARFAPLVVAGLALVGTLFSLYLTFLEPFVINAVCIWCLTSSVIMTLILLVSVRPAVQCWNAYKQGR